MSDDNSSLRGALGLREEAAPPTEAPFYCPPPRTDHFECDNVLGGAHLGFTQADVL